MTKASDNAFPSLLITEGTEPSAPAAGKQRLYIDSTTHKLKRTDSSGTDVTIEQSGSVATDAIFDAKGDLAAGTGADTAAKLTVGSNGTLLVADSAQSQGLKWAFAPALVGVQAYHNTTQAITGGANTAASMNSEDWDTHTFHDTSSNTSRITIPSGKDGYYLLQGTVYCAGNPAAFAAWFRKNNTSNVRGSMQEMRATAAVVLNISAIALLAATDYIEMMVFLTNSLNIGDGTFVEQQTTVRATLLGT